MSDENVIHMPRRAGPRDVLENAAKEVKPDDQVIVIVLGADITLQLWLTQINSLHCLMAAHRLSRLADEFIERRVVPETPR